MKRLLISIGILAVRVGQEKAGEFAGQKVKITGRLTGKTIRVTAIEVAT